MWNAATISRSPLLPSSRMIATLGWRVRSETGTLVSLVFLLLEVMVHLYTTISSLFLLPHGFCFGNLHSSDHTFVNRLSKDIQCHV